MSTCRKHQRRAEHGFTLIELLVAMALMGALSAGMLIAMRNGLLTMERTNARLDQNRRAMGVLSLIRRQIAAAIPAKGLCPGLSVGPIEVFRGDALTMVFVTSESLSQGSRGYPQIARYQFRPNTDGTSRFEVTEQVFSGVASTAPYCQAGFPLVDNMPPPVVLYDRLAGGGFAYYQADPFTRRTLGWTNGWTQKHMPAAIRIEIQPTFDRAPRLPIASLTVPLRISRDPMSEYRDEIPPPEEY